MQAAADIMWCLQCLRLVRLHEEEYKHQPTTQIWFKCKASRLPVCDKGEVQVTLKRSLMPGEFCSSPAISCPLLIFAQRSPLKKAARICMEAHPWATARPLLMLTTE